MVELRPYQREAEEAIMQEWTGKDKTLLVLPTGCGKTIVFADVARQRTEAGRVLILAHRDELLHQAADKIKKSCGLDCSVEKAEQSCIGRDEMITVGSVQTMQTEKRLSNFPKDYFRTVIVDEAHHCMASSYQNVLNHFDGAKVLGVTATPDRGDMQNLGKYFESLAYEYTLLDAIRQGYLVKLQALTIPLNIDLSGVKISQGDYQLAQVGDALEPYLEQIADSMVEHCKGKHTVVFLPLVSTSKHFRDLLNERGLRAAEVNGQSEDREEILQDFEDGKYDVICNSMLLTEGWDCPIVDCVVVLRPTKVRSLYCQMIGRGTRLAPGKNHLLILDFLWHTERHELVHPADIVCKDRNIAKKVTEKLEKSEDGGDIFELEEEAIKDAKAEREAALAAELKAQRLKKKKLIDPLQFEMSIADADLADYVPTFGWEMEPPSEKQLQTIEKFGLNTDSITCKGQANLYLDRLIKRSQSGLASVKQMNQLEQRGFQHVGEWTFEDASKMMGLLAKNSWRLPNFIDPQTYIPQSMRRKEDIAWI